MKIQRYLLCYITLLLLLITVEKAKSQNTCSSAIVFNNSNIDSTLLYGNSGTVFWLKFTANSKNYVIELSQPVQTPFSGLKYFQLYKGTCTNLELVSLDSSNFTAINLISGQDYFLAINKIDTNYSYFNLKIGIDTNDYSVYKFWNISECPPPSCEHIMNSGFNIQPGWTDFNDAFQFNANTGGVCGWLSLCGTPSVNISSYLGSTPPTGWMYSLVDGTSIVGEAIQQQLITPLLPLTTYQFSFDWLSVPNLTNPLDELCIYLVDPNNSINLTPQIYNTLGQHNPLGTGLRDVLETAIIGNLHGIKIGGQNNPLLINLSNFTTWTHVDLNFICNDPDFTLLIILPFDDDANGSSLHFDNVHITPPIEVTAQIKHSCSGKLDGGIDLTVCGYSPITSYLWSNGATTQDISLVNPGTYTVTITYGNNQTFIQNYTILQYSYPQQPDLGHYITTVCAPSSSYQYTILNPETNVTYTWSLNPSNAGTITGSPGNSVTINWANPTQASIVIHCANSVTGCEIDYTYEVNEPCLPTGNYYLCNINSTASINPVFTNNGSYSGYTYIVNGYFIIDNNNMTFTNCTFFMGPLANIQIANNVAITTFNSCYFYSERNICMHMWDGMYVESSNSLVVLNQSTMMDAINGLVSKNGGQLTLTGDWLTDNYHCVQIKDYTPASGTNLNVTLKSCTLQGSAVLPYPPYYGYRPYTGILVKNIGAPNTTDGVIIGNTSISTYKNSFINLHHGIIVEQSNIQIYNNEFTNNLGAQSYTLEAIYLAGSYNAPIFPYPKYNATIGGTNTNYPNLINMYATGIEALNSMNLNIIKNTFTNCTMGVYFHNFGDNISPCNTIVNVSRNVITNGMVYGINALANPNCNAAITCNNITMAASGLTTGIKITGTSINNSSEIYTLNANTINAINGITVLNAYRINANSNSVTLQNNAFGTPSYGMRFQNCDYQYVYNTNIGGVTTSTTNKYGISIENTTHPLYKCNTINYTDRAFNISGTNTNPLVTVTILKNTYNNSNYGMVKSNSGLIGQQGNTTTPWLNKWNTVTNHTWGIAPVLNDNCYARTYSPYLNESFNNNPTIFTKVAVSCNPCTVPMCPTGVMCSYIPLSNELNTNVEPGDNLQNALAINNPAYILQNNIIANSLNLNDVAWYLAKQKVYAQMIADKSTFMQDAGFSSFITGSDNNSVGLLYYADKYIGKAKADSAEMFNDNIAITNIADSVHKFVNTQYISYLRYKELSETTKAQLRDIAFLCPFAFGDGVYVARGLLNIADSMQMNYTNICETGSAKTKSMINEDINEDVNMQIVLYPNPAKDLLTIEYTNTENTTGTIQFEIYDLMGKRLRESIVNPNQNTIVSTDALSQGIYLYKFLYKNKIVKKDKLVIIK